MALRTKHIGLVFGLLAVLSGQAFAQGQTFEEDHWPVLSSERSMEQEVLGSLENLKRAEAALNDSSTIAALDSIGYLAILQSGFKGTAADENQRKGWWLLSYPVAIKYGLIINSAVDERMDLSKSTKAAFQYHQDLVKQYGAEKADLVFVESPLAVSKFLTDSINFQEQYKQIQNTRKQLNLVYSLFIENRNNNPVGPVQEIVAVSSSQPISFEVLHHFLQVPSAELSKLNPQCVSGVYDPAFGALNIPSSVSKTFADKQGEMEQKTRDDEILLVAANEKRIKQLKGNIPDLTTHKPISYKVKMGDNLGRIAQRYHVRINDLRAWNNLRNDRIYAGQRMTIYVPKSQQPEPIATVTPKPQVKPSTPSEFEEYTVKQGDTLWAISQKYGHVSIEHIMADNGIGENISPGQVLKIRKQ